ncbi:MAG: ABC transporter substrate-binding protein [Deltaproteobacteria bacterium]|nr:ABC transporter substrate-binding protein [Deltaproteobacteria bacterium]
MTARLTIILVVWLALASTANAVTPASANAVSPLDYTRTILEQARTIVAGNQTHDQKVAALSVLFGKFLDTDAMGREALGQHWSSFTPAQQKEFLPLFRELIQRAYVQDLLLFQNPDFVYVGQQLLTGGALVDTKIVTPKDKFDIKYTLIPAGNKWMVTAITVEGVSLVGNYGNQFNRVLARMTPDDLIALMRRKFGNPNGEA